MILLILKKGVSNMNNINLIYNDIISSDYINVDGIEFTNDQLKFIYEHLKIELLDENVIKDVMCNLINYNLIKFMERM